ncbi:MAG: ribosomal protein S18-alanine N-acetyltransferase [Firmicutes bacterium]|nr:ribosomal protein S18-alanine N-acetyltransferase [Bacillota bacterium]
MSVEIFDALPAHISQIYAIETRCFRTPWTPAQLSYYLEIPGFALLIAVENAKILGYLCLDSVLDEGSIANLAVIPEYRRRGIGESLLCAAELRARKRALKVLYLEVRKSNAAAVALYEKQGFQRVGLRKGYYTNPTEDAILMTKTL